MRADFFAFIKHGKLFQVLVTSTSYQIHKSPLLPSIHRFSMRYHYGWLMHFILGHRRVTFKYEVPSRFELTVTYYVLCRLFWPQCRPFNGIVLSCHRQSPRRRKINCMLQNHLKGGNRIFSSVIISLPSYFRVARIATFIIAFTHGWRKWNSRIYRRGFHRKITVALINLCAILYLRPDIALQLLFFCVGLNCQTRQLVFKQ